MGVPGAMWWRAVVVTLCTGLFGWWAVLERPVNPWLPVADEACRDWIAAQTPRLERPPVMVTVVEMENASGWTALDYTLFLRCMEARPGVVVVLASLPPPEDTAYYRAFVAAALRQPRLILPVTLSPQPGPDRGAWLEAVPVVGKQKTGSDATVFQSVTAGPPEELRGVVGAGAINLPGLESGGDGQVPLILPLDDRLVPSVILRAVLAAWRVPLEKAQWEWTGRIAVPGWSRATDGQGWVPVDRDFFPGLRRVKSGDLLFALDPQAGAPHGATVDWTFLDGGVVILGDPADRAADKNAWSRAEVLAAAVATVCNGSPWGGFPVWLEYALMGLAVGYVLVLTLQRGDVRVTMLIFAGAVGVWLALQVAAESGRVLPLFLPFFTLLFGFFLAEGGRRLFQRRKNGTS